MMKKILVLMICAALCLSLIPAASADGVILWERLDTGDVIAMTRQPTEEELKNLKLHTHSYGDWVVITQASCSEAGLRYRICSKCGYKDTETIGKTEHCQGSNLYFGRIWLSEMCKVWIYAGICHSESTA